MTTTVIAVLIAVVATLIIAVPVTSRIAVARKVREDQARIGSAEEKARQIIDDALKGAETKKREALLEAKEESLKIKNESEREAKERRAEVTRLEKRVMQKEETADKKLESLERREAGVAQKEEELRKKQSSADKLLGQRQQELERISGLTSEQAKEYLLKSVEDEVKTDAAKLYKELENEARESAAKKAQEFVVTAIQRCAADNIAEAAISVVQLPSDEMKGRIIGREGRNIRAIETLTGVDLIIDDTPEAVVLSSFDPIRREVARVALEKLIVDGRIHPARIEETVDKAKKEVENEIREAGDEACLQVGVHGLVHDLRRVPEGLPVAGEEEAVAVDVLHVPERVQVVLQGPVVVAGVPHDGRHAPEQYVPAEEDLLLLVPEAHVAPGVARQQHQPEPVVPVAHLVAGVNGVPVEDPGVVEAHD